ncbi:hypothetical protein Agub_g5295 [Astrephomene gubernaculifera]|uniref:J domain-containing protein n=1 Tax=Astrephomene gubernaculifera TaxID=47775 RepID=A0AAD3DQN0_9CHLO|nr:hypothetical protein Agub_g5295 [Astrephomene gubernaculifera]
MRGTVLPQTSRCKVTRAAAAPRRPVVVTCAFMAASRSLALGGKCPYRTLGVSYDADEEAIKVAFRRKAKQCHPDVCPTDPLATLAFLECQHAYQTLLDPEKRAKYDKTLLPRANCNQALSYLNARSCARHGISISRMAARGACTERPELYSTMLDLLQQVKSCAKNLEREIIAKDSTRPHSYGLHRSATFAPSITDGKLVVQESLECSEHECCEPWVYYAAQSEAATKRRF